MTTNICKTALTWMLVLTATAVTLTAVPCFVRSESLSSQEIQMHLQRGENFFKRGMELDRTDPETARDYFSKSILHLERIVNEGGVENGKLYYNIGNAYFRLGEIGSAILSYKRAALYIPNNPNLKHNIEYARSRRVDKIEKQVRDKVLKTLFFLHYDIPFRTRFVVFSAVFALVWICASLTLFIGWKSVRLVLIVSSIIGAVFLASLVAEGASYYRRPEGVIIAGEVVARKGDAETYQPSFTEPLHSGTEFVLLTRRSDWWQVELENGAQCWIPSSSGELVLEQ